MDHLNPNELSFWKARLSDKTVLTALATYPKEAREIFGVVPTMRKNVYQLAMILAAREVLAAPENESPRTLKSMLGDKIFDSLVGRLNPEQQSKIVSALSPEVINERVLNWARAVIREATGVEN